MFRVIQPGQTPPQGAPSGPPTLPPGPGGPAGPPPPPDGGAPPLDPKGAKFDAEKVKPETAGYTEGPPPQCGACHHFDGQGSCEIVAGPINPQAWCCLFEADGQAPPDDDQDTPSGPPSPGLA